MRPLHVFGCPVTDRPCGKVSALGLGCDFRAGGVATIATSATQGAMFGEMGLRHLRQPRHGACDGGLCRGCRVGRRGVPCDFHQLCASVKPHRPPPSRCATLPCVQPSAPRFRGQAPLSSRGFKECPARPAPLGFRAPRSAQGAPQQAKSMGQRHRIPGTLLRQRRLLLDCRAKVKIFIHTHLGGGSCGLCSHCC